MRAGPPDTRVASTRAAPSRAPRCVSRRCPAGGRAGHSHAGGRGHCRRCPRVPRAWPATPTAVSRTTAGPAASETWKGRKRCSRTAAEGRRVAARVPTAPGAGGGRMGCRPRTGSGQAVWAPPHFPETGRPRRQQRWVLLCSASEMGRPAATVKPGCHQTVASPGSRPGRGWGGPTATRPGPARGTGFQPQNRCTPFPALVTARGHWDPPSATHQDSPTHRDAPTTPAVWAQPRGFPSGPWGPHPAAPGHGLGWRACCRLLGSACRIRVGLQAALPTRLVSTVDTTPPPPICPAPRPGRGRPPASTMWGRRAWCLHTPKTDLDPGDSWLKSPLSLNV